MIAPKGDRQKRALSAVAVFVAVIASGIATVVSTPASIPACSSTSCYWSCPGSSCPWQNPFIGSLSFAYCNHSGVGDSSLGVSEPSTSRGAIQLTVAAGCNATAGGSVERKLWAGLNSPTFTAWKPTGDPYHVTVTWRLEGALVANATCGPPAGMSAPPAGNASVLLFTTIDSFDFTLLRNPQSYVQSNLAVANSTCAAGPPPRGLVIVDLLSTQQVVGFTFHQGDGISISTDVGLDVFVFTNDGQSRASGLLSMGAPGVAAPGATLESISIN